MNKKTMLKIFFLLSLMFIFTHPCFAADTPSTTDAPPAVPAPGASVYKIGVDDILDINILRPEPLATTLTVSRTAPSPFPISET